MKMNLFEKLCDMMLTAGTSRGKFVYADKILAKKPQTLGEGLARIKAKFGVVEQIEPRQIGDSRIYVANDGSNVWFSNNGSSLAIHKEVLPLKFSEYNKVFSGKLAGVHKNYLNINLGDEVHIDRSINIDHFKPIKAADDLTGKIASHNIDRQGVLELGYQNFSHKHYHNAKDVPYAKAVAMGMKV